MEKDTAKIVNEIPGSESEPDLRLHDAVCDPDNIEEIENLIEEDENLVFARDHENRTPIMILAHEGEEQAVDIAKMLLGVNDEGHIERPSLLTMVDSNEYSVLHYAALTRQPELVSALLKWGANPGLKNNLGNNPLHLAVEGKLEYALNCASEILKYDTDHTIVNMMNNNEEIPLLKAVKAKSLLIVELLLQPEYKVNLSLKDKKEQTLLHNACSESDETDESIEVLKVLVKKCNASQLNATDKNGKTALHLAAIKRRPEVCRILVEDERTDVFKIDSLNKTALHYAAENGCYPKGNQCVEALISRRFKTDKDQVKYLYQMKDQSEITPFMYACINCPVETVEKIIGLANKPKFWLTPNLKLIYKHSPLAIRSLMNRAFSEDKSKSSDAEDDILIDFGSITGYDDPVEKCPQQESVYLNEALKWEFDTQRQILLHPLVQYYITKKWQKLRWFIVLCVFCQFMWLSAYTTLALTFYSKSIQLETNTVRMVAAIYMLSYIAVSILNELFELCTTKLAYLMSLTNAWQLVQNILGFIVIKPIFGGYDGFSDVEKYCAGAGILLAFVLSMRDTGKLNNEMGLIVEVLKQVVIIIIRVLLCCSLLIFGFTLAFVVIFDDEETLTSTFPGPIVKVLVMMTGEFEYKDTFQGDADKPRPIGVMKLFFFLTFLITVPVAFFNLLTGFALDKVLELRERAKVGRIVKQLEHVYFIETVLNSLRPLRKVYPGLIAWLRQGNVTTAWLDGAWGFETVLKEEILKSDRKLKKQRRFFTCGALCPTKLPAEVREQIYAMAAPASKKRP